MVLNFEVAPSSITLGKSSSKIPFPLSFTFINFLPSKSVFSLTEFSSSILQKRMKELAFLNKGLSIILVDKTAKKEKEYKN